MIRLAGGPERLYWDLCLLVVITAVMSVAGETQIMHALDVMSFSVWTSAAPKAPDPPDLIWAIDIDDTAYHNKYMFCGKSPLNIDLVKKLVRFAVDGDAAVVGVDIDTSGWTPDQFDGFRSARVVWGGRPAERGLHYGHFVLNLDLTIPMLVRHPAPVPDATGTGRIQDSLSDAVVKLYCSQRPANAPECADVAEGTSTEPNHIRYIRTKPGSAEPLITYLPADKILCPNCVPSPDAADTSAGSAEKTRKAEKECRTQTDGPVASAAKQFSGKIVLIGGTASDFRDFHVTPFGQTSGLGVQADLVASRLMKPVPDLPVWGQVLSDFAMGFLIYVFFKKASMGFKKVLGRRPTRARRLWCQTGLFLSIVTVPPLIAGLVSWWLWQAGLFVAFLPMYVGVIVNEWVESRLEHVNRHLDGEHKSASEIH